MCFFCLSDIFFPAFFSYKRILKMCIELYGSQIFSNCLETNYASIIILSDWDGIKSTKQIKERYKFSDSYRKVKSPLDILQWQGVSVKLNHKEKKTPVYTISSSVGYSVTSLIYLQGYTTLLSPAPSITPQRAFCVYPLHIRRQK